ncbi:zinc finger, CCHC-type containing protein [Tanacetum coccineum]
MTTTVANNSVFRAFFEKQRLAGPNFIDCTSSGCSCYPAAWVKASKEITGLMIMTMEPYIQKNLEQLGAYDMLKELKTLFAQQAEQKLLQTVREFHACKQEEGQSVSSYVLKMKSYIDNLERLGHSMSQNLAGLKGSRKLKLGALSLYVGDGHRAAVEAIGSFYLCLPSGLVLVLHNCHYAPSITRGIILVSGLYDDGFINRFENNTILVSKNNVVYFSVIPRDGIFEIDLSNSNTNDSSMYAVSNKRAKINLDSTLLWHCHLGHIRKKRIKKLQHDGLLNSTDN